ncbi:MAG: isoaspartyl peptidase/L-asparaginase [Deltaproteobacteria bacterium]|nr:isoaspartyl peptidase/L-asparaginase [Deltaproteobacteria bacterium]
MILVHGGAGTVAPDRHDRLRAGVRAAAAAGHAILAAGGYALDAVVASVRILEDDPEFNAGTGSALTRDGSVETEACVMDGTTHRIGAVAAVPDLANPIAVALAVLEAGEHVILAGPAALRFAAELGISPAPQGALITDRMRDRLAEAAAHEATASAPVDRSGGTVGAVARDRHGNLAAATSTGGIVYKRSGRVGDSPIPGAGTWADRTAAISATGDGEAILRVALSRGVAARVAAGMPLREAAIASLRELHEITGGSAGLIALDGSSRVFVQLSPTMPVAWVDASGGGDSIGDLIS